jgi:hypothetical protein
MKKILGALALIALANSAHAGFFPTTLAGNTTGIPGGTFLGAPDDTFVGIGGQSVTYDFGARVVLNRPGAVDFNVYEVDWGGPESGEADVLVSNDGIRFTSVWASGIVLTPGNRIAGDSGHGDNSFAQSYDLGSFASVRYIRIDGIGNGPAGGQVNATVGFDLDAVGAHQVAAIPEPETWALLLAGLGLLGLSARRRNRAAA